MGIEQTADGGERAAVMDLPDLRLEVIPRPELGIL
jgi:hypothetical protein